MNIMKIKSIFSILLLSAAVLGFQSCSDSDSGSSAVNITAPGTVLSLVHEDSPIEELNIPMGELTSYMISVKTDGGWKVSVPEADASWVHITPHAGYGWDALNKDAVNTRAYVKLSVDYNEGAARSTQLTFTTGNLQAVLRINQAGKGSGSDPIESVWDMVGKLKMGYNLGNTLESNHDLSNSWFNPSGPGDWQTWETCWGQPQTTQEIINAIADKGFNIIRVPVTWFPHMDEEGNIDEQWMNRVEEVVNYVLNANCYCIINVMHDTGARGADRTDRHCWLTADIDKYPENTILYQKIWTQICERFKNYDERLIFESFNEILNSSYSWTAPSSESDGAYEAINKLQQDFVNVVRASGGNNKYRNLAVTTYSATGNADAPVNAFKAPQDQVSDHMYLTIHSYDPYNFCNNNSGKAPDGSTYDYNILIFDDDCKAVIDGVFARVNKRATECGIPFIFGEFGALDYEKSMAERVKYAQYMASKFKQYKTAGLWWMNLINRNDLTTTIKYDANHIVDESPIIDALFQ